MPVKVVARLAMQIEVVQKWLSNTVPSAASRSMFGVWMMRLPMHPIASQRWSSVSNTMKLGRFGFGPAPRA